MVVLEWQTKLSNINKRCRNLLAPESEIGDKTLEFGFINWTPILLPSILVLWFLNNSKNTVELGRHLLSWTWRVALSQTWSWKIKDYHILSYIICRNESHSTNNQLIITSPPKMQPWKMEMCSQVSPMCIIYWLSSVYPGFFCYAPPANYWESGIIPNYWLSHIIIMHPQLLIIRVIINTLHRQ